MPTDATAGLTMDHRSEEGREVLLLAGEIDPHSAPRLADCIDEVIQDRPDATLVLDLARVTFIDSSGIRALIEAKRRMDDGGGSLELANPTPATRRLLQITGLTTFLAVEP